MRSARQHAALPLIVQLSSERAGQAVRPDCSFAKKQESPTALLVVVRRDNVLRVRPDACSCHDAGVSVESVLGFGCGSCPRSRAGWWSVTRPSPRRTKAFAELTPREVDVVRLVARGVSNAEIGGELFLSEATVKTHLTSILRKVGLRDRTQLVVLAYERGLVRPGDAGL
jgi:DNA-binding CsgD family transcriptional regulator